MAELHLRALRKRYGQQDVVRDVTLAIASGEFVSLLGPSGCGKTTLLRMIAGLVLPSAGEIRVDERDITRLPPHRRQLGLVFQSYALFPHLTVAANVAFGLRRGGVRGAELRTRTEEALALVRLTHLSERMPRQLSGGQQQRVALARAVAPRPRLLLLDEPLSNLDAQLRDEMQIEIKRLQRELGITSLFVTHDQAEALSLSDRVCVLDRGVVQQVGTPEAIYGAPTNAFVAGFIGRSNRLRGEIAGREGEHTVLRLADGSLVRTASGNLPGRGAVEIIIRHDAVRILPPDQPGTLAGTIVMRSFAGASVQRVVRLDGGLELVSEAPSSMPGALDARVALDIAPDAVFASPA
jgi:putative spermidine/putrescine transport system ATP-binding protein